MTRLESLWNEHADLAARGRAVDMTRGNPSKEQQALSMPMLDCMATGIDQIDCANYGLLEGLPQARRLFAQYLGCLADQVIVLNNSSLTLMHDIVVQALVRGIGDNSWRGCAFICPVPGYDRHFTICERYGIDMIPVELYQDGPDMACVRELAAQPHVVGMWCVPKYSNPSGITYSPGVVRELAAMPTANPSFRIFWDCAYLEHHLTCEDPRLCNLMVACEQAGNPDRYFAFASMSKITLAGAAIAAVAMSDANKQWFLKGLSAQTIGGDKLNQLRHVQFLPDMAALRAHMRKHRGILAPRFTAVDEELTKRLGGRNLASWTKPQGGYFISLTTPNGCAARVVEIAESAGVKLTKAGAAYPYGRNPLDNHLRIAPSMPNVDDVRHAAKVLALAIDIASEEQP